MSRPTTKRVNGRWYDINSAAERIAELEAKVERLEKAIQHCDPLCPAWAALEGKQE